MSSLRRRDGEAVRRHLGKPGVMPNGERLHVFLHVWPSDPNDLPTDRRRFGSDDLADFRLTPRWRKDGKCYAVCRRAARR